MMEYQRAAEATGDLIGNNIAKKNTKVSRNLPQYNLRTITIEHDKKKCVEKYI